MQVSRQGSRDWGGGIVIFPDQKRRLSGQIIQLLLTDCASVAKISYRLKIALSYIDPNTVRCRT
jgi:hypothetical protein